MAYESNYITMIGNLTDDPELRYTQGGTPVTSFRLATNRRYQDRNGQQQEETTYMPVNCWRDTAENAAASLNKGDRTIVIGRLRNRSYENKDGQTVYVTEIEADEIAPSLRWATTTITRNTGGQAPTSSQPSAATPNSTDPEPIPF